jgi:hypothetical protein
MKIKNLLTRRWKMPNWCNNHATLEHPDLAMLQKAKDGFNNKNEGRGMLSALIPCPQPLYDTVAGSNLQGDQFDPYRAELQAFQEKLNLKYFGHKNWYDWCISEWGTKWDIGRDSDYGDEAEIENGECLKIFFDSAWSPPIKAYEKLEELGFTITASYYEPGCDFCGEWENGQDYEYCLKDAPAHLDRLYGISEMLEMIE